MSACLRASLSVFLLTWICSGNVPCGLDTLPHRPPRSSGFLSGWDLNHMDKLGLGHQTVCGRDTDWSRRSPGRPRRVRATARNSLGEGMWRMVTVPIGQHRAGHFLLPQRAAQPEATFHFLCSCPSRVQAVPPEAIFKFCQHLSPHTRSSQAGPFKQLIQTNCLGLRLWRTGRRKQGRAVLGRAGGVSSSTLGTQAAPLPVGRAPPTTHPPH